MSELKRLMDEFTSGITAAWNAYAAITREVLKAMTGIAETIKQVSDAKILHGRIWRYATPNERRMMHNKRRRIRMKYYNRVKRRIEAKEKELKQSWKETDF